MKQSVEWNDCGLSSGRWNDLALRLKAHVARRMRRESPQDESLLEWGKRYLGAYFRRPQSGLHLWLGEQLDRMTHQRGTKLNLIGPRGGAKSTLATLAYVLRSAVEGWEPYIWIVSDTKHQARRHLENLRAELCDNPQLAADYPAATGKGRPWRGDAIQLRNGVTVEALGTLQRARGRRHRADRPTLVVCDDLQNDGHMLSPTLRETSRLWFQGTLLKAGSPATNFLNLATALHRDALALELHRTPGWTSRVFAAIVRWPDNMSLWHQWEEIYCRQGDEAGPAAARELYLARQADMDSGAVLLWPEEEDLYTLMRMRAEGGRAAFEREKQGVPLNPAMCEWPQEYFDEHIWFDEWPQGLRLKVVALDPSKGSDARRGDYSAFVLLGVDAAGLLYVEADLARRATPEMVASGVELCRTFRPDAFGVETNQFQQLLADEFAHEFARQGLLDVHPWSIDNRVNKGVRIRRLGPYLKDRRLRFRGGSPGTRMLVEQLQTFPAGDHDDGPDALEMAIRLAGELLAPAGAADALGERLPIAVP